MKKQGTERKKKVLIFGAGPTGLTAAYELLKPGQDKYQVTVLEKDPDYVGGIARTVKYKGYRFDTGGHRFFSKSQEIEAWWQEVMGQDFLTRPRLSRWFYRGKFFSYPIKPLEILRVFGIGDSLRMILGYFRVKFFPIRPEKNLADYYVNQFGTFLAKPFFIAYNEKLWGISCDQLSIDFAKQRVKGLSFTSAIVNSFKKKLGLEKRGEVKTLVDEFRYPKHGPGMLWEKVKNLVEKRGGSVFLDREVIEVHHQDFKITGVVVKDGKGEKKTLTADYFLSTIPLKRLVKIIRPAPPQEILAAAEKLKFQNFITVALVINRANLFPDNWIYTHDEGVRSIRVQNFNNWSPYLVPDPQTTCLGFEYTCGEKDDFWSASDQEVVNQALQDLEKTGFAFPDEVKDSRVVRLTDVYPAYTIGYQQEVTQIRNYLDQFNQERGHQLQVIGRGGMHRYNNMDHSMMTAILAVKNLKGEDFDVWQVNVDAEYHEKK